MLGLFVPYSLSKYPNLKTIEKHENPEVVALIEPQKAKKYDKEYEYAKNGLFVQKIDNKLIFMDKSHVSAINDMDNKIFEDCINRQCYTPIALSPIPELEKKEIKKGKKKKIVELLSVGNYTDLVVPTQYDYNEVKRVQKTMKKVLKKPKIQISYMYDKPLKIEGITKTEKLEGYVAPFVDDEDFDG